MVRRRLGIVDIGCRNRLGIGRRVSEIARAGQHTAGREGRLAGGFLAACSGATAGAGGQIKYATQHFYEHARQGEIRPIGVCGDVIENDHAFSAMFGGHQGRSIGKARPDLGGKIGGGLGKDLAIDDNGSVEGDSRKWTGLGEGLQRLRRFPG